MPRVYFDFEFTALKPTAKPISLGCVTDSGAWTFYAEFTGYEQAECTDFVIDHVLPKLHYRSYTPGRFPANDRSSTNYSGSTGDVAVALQHWLHTVWLHAGESEQIEMWGDVCAYDWVLFNDLFYGILPKEVYYIPFDIATLMKLKGVDPDINRIEFSNTYFLQGQHDALQDALVIALCYGKLMEGER